MGSDESHFNVSLIERGQSEGSVHRPQAVFEERGEPKRSRTEVLNSALITCLTNALPLGQTIPLKDFFFFLFFLTYRVYVNVNVCVCVCVRERERERERVVCHVWIC